MELSLDVKFKRFVECDYFLRLNRFRSCNLASHHLKMSELENKVGSAENGFLNCQQCSRRYLTFVGLDYHAKLEHSGLNLKQIKEKQDSNLKQIEEKQDLNCVLNDVSAKIHPEFQEDQESFLKLKISAQSHAWQVDDIFGQKVGFLALFPGHTSPLPRIFGGGGDNTF